MCEKEVVKPLLTTVPSQCEDQEGHGYIFDSHAIALNIYRDGGLQVAALRILSCAHSGILRGFLRHRSSEMDSFVEQVLLCRVIYFPSVPSSNTEDDVTLTNMSMCRASRTFLLCKLPPPHILLDSGVISVCTYGFDIAGGFERRDS